MGRVWPSRCTRISILGPIRSKAAVSARRNDAANDKSKKKPNDELRKRLQNSIKTQFSLLEVRTVEIGQVEQKRRAGSDEILWKVYGIAVPRLLATDEGLLVRFRQDKAADIRSHCELRR